MFQGCLIEDFRVFTESVMSFLRKFKGCFKEVSGKFIGCFKKVSRVLQVKFLYKRDILGMLKWCFQGVSRKFQACFQKVSRVFKESFKGVSMKIKGCCNVVLSLFQVGSNWVLKVIDRSSKTILVVSRKFQGSSKKGFRMFKGRFKSVPMKF